MSDVETVEMRGDVPRDLYDVFDAVRLARGMTKQALLVAIVAEWAAKEVHVATVVSRVTRGKAPASPREWGGDGS
jgi:hypothetical protein